MSAFLNDAANSTTDLEAQQSTGKKSSIPKLLSTFVMGNICDYKLLRIGQIIQNHHNHAHIKYIR